MIKHQVRKIYSEAPTEKREQSIKHQVKRQDPSNKKQFEKSKKYTKQTSSNNTHHKTLKKTENKSIIIKQTLNNSLK